MRSNDVLFVYHNTLQNIRLVGEIKVQYVIAMGA